MDGSGTERAGDFRGRLFRKYVGYFAGLLSVALLASGATGLYFSYRDTRALVDELQREKARAAAARIEQYLHTVENQLRSAVALRRGEEPPDPDQQYLELLRLLRLAPAVADAAWIDAGGRERVRVSRIARDMVDGSIDRSHEPGFTAAAAGRTWYGEVYFRRETEPHVAIVVAGGQREQGVLLAEINLKFVWDVVSAIRFGDAGHAYVVDARGRLVSHPDISLVLRMSDLSTLPQVRAALTNVLEHVFLRVPLLEALRCTAAVLRLAAAAGIAGTGAHLMIVHGFEASSAYFFTALSSKSNPRPGAWCRMRLPFLCASCRSMRRRKFSTWSSGKNST